MGCKHILKPIFILKVDNMQKDEGLENSIQFKVEGFRDKNDWMLLINPKMSKYEMPWRLSASDELPKGVKELGRFGWWIHPSTEYIDATNLHKILYGIKEGASAT